VVSGAELCRRRPVVDAFLSAALTATSAPCSRTWTPMSYAGRTPSPCRWARRQGCAARETVLPRERARHADLAPVEGTVGLVVASRGRLLIAVTLAVEGERITAYEVIADPVRLRGLDLAVLEK
jgi:hypothetical protein